MLGDISLLDSKEWVFDQYVTQLKSTTQIAQELGTYVKKVVRALVKHGITIRTKNESQAIALQRGRAKHPTLGELRPVETREKISKTQRGKHGKKENDSSSTS